MKTMKGRVDTSDFDRKMGNILTDLKPKMRGSISTVGKRTETIMKHDAPFYRGNLRKSISKEWIGDLMMKIGSDLPYALPTITGTGPMNPPFGKIESWANFRGLPAGAIYSNLKSEGMDSAKESPYRKNWFKSGQEFAEDNMEREMEKDFKRWLEGFG